MITIVERLLEDDDVVLELPYVRRIGDKGRQEGRREGETEMLLRLLRLRFGPLPTDAVARVQAANPETLWRWSERLLTAAILEEVFAA
jgi:hypothetical protein